MLNSTTHTEMARRKKIVQEIALDSDASETEHEKPAKKEKVVESEEEEEPPARPPVKARNNDKKMESLRMANEARLRRKVPKL